MSANKQFKKASQKEQTDSFSIECDKKTKVQLIIKPLAYDVLTKLYPMTKNSMKKQADNRYRFEDTINPRFEGLINIVVGYSRSIEIIEPDALREEAKMHAKNLLSEI